MKKSLVISLHIGFWSCYLILIVMVLGIYYRTILTADNPQYSVMNAFNTILIFAFLPSFVSYWTYYFFLFSYLKQRRILLSIIYGFIISMVAAVIGYIILRYMIETGRIIDMDEGGRHGRSTAVKVILVMASIGAICGGVALVIKGFITWYNEIKLKEELTERNYEMEMALIKAQLDPHLLFNTINNIDTLIARDPMAASDYLNKLSDIMRFVLYEIRGEKISLAAEISYIQKYIALQKIRTSNEDYVRFEVSGVIGNKRIAPMVFIPFIENAFKHTSNKKIEHAIAVRIVIKDETTQLICENRYDSKVVKQSHHDGGLGNELVQKRLELIYKGQHKLQINKSGDFYSVNLTIPNE